MPAATLPPSQRGAATLRGVAFAALAISLASLVVLAWGLGRDEPPPVAAPGPQSGPAASEETPTAIPDAAVVGPEGPPGGRLDAEPGTDPFGNGPLTAVAFEVVGRVVSANCEPVKGASATLFVSPVPLLSPALATHFRDPGMPIEEMRVKTTTDGAFRFRGPFEDGNEYLLVVKHPGSAPIVKRGLPVERGSRCDVGELQLEPGLELAGDVTGPSGEPVPGARIGVVDAPSFWAVERFLENCEPDEWMTAGDDGRFVVKNLTDGRYVAVAYAKGLARAASPPVVLGRDLDRTAISIRLAAGATISGTVTGPEGSGIPGASVRVRQRYPNGKPNLQVSSDEVQAADSFFFNYPISVTTNEAGDFEIEGLVAGIEYTLTATADGHRKSNEVPVKSGASGVRIRLLRDFEVKGRVVDATTGEPVPGAHVARFEGRVEDLRRGASQFPASRATTDGEGRFTLREDGKAGNANLLAWFPWTSGVKNPGYAPSLSDPFVLTDAAPIPELTVKMPKGAAAAGTVVSGATGRPLGGVALQLFAVRERNAANARPFGIGAYLGSTVSDSRGRFAFEGLLPGTYCVEARDHASGFNRTDVLSLGPADRREDLSIVMPALASIRGSVLTAGSLAAVRVTATRYDGLSITRFCDATNRFSLDKLAPGLYRVQASKLTAAEERMEWWSRRSTNDSSVTVDLKDGQIVVVDLELPDSNIGRLTGTITDGIEPASGYTVVAVRDNPQQQSSVVSEANKDPRFGNSRTVTSDVRGIFEFPSLREGTYRIFAIPRGKSLTPKNAVASDFIQIFGNSDGRRDLFGRRGAVRGTVIQPNGQGLSGATVTAIVNDSRSPTPVLPAGTRFTTRTRGDGTFDFGILPGGAYDLTVDRPPFPKKVVPADVFGGASASVAIQLEAPANRNRQNRSTAR